jgi:hypothetical protein
MIKIGRNEEFDFIYTCTLDGEKHQGEIENMNCAPTAS